MVSGSAAGHFSSFILAFSPHHKTHQSFLTRNLSRMTSLKDFFFFFKSSQLFVVDRGRSVGSGIEDQQNLLLSINDSKLYNHTVATKTGISVTHSPYSCP